MPGEGEREKARTGKPRRREHFHRASTEKSRQKKGYLERSRRDGIGQEMRPRDIPWWGGTVRDRNGEPGAG